MAPTLKPPGFVWPTANVGVLAAWLKAKPANGVDESTEKKTKSYLEIAKSKLFSCNFRTMRQRLKFELKLNSDALVATPPNVKPPPLEELEAPEKDKM